MSPAHSPALPPLYDGWISSLLGESVVSEPAATCSDCAMCVSGASNQQEGRAFGFKPDVKCCTYLPQLWNFLAGRVLADHSTDGAVGRRTLEARIAAGDGVTPLSVGRTRRYHLLYTSGADGFGRAGSLRCPHYIEEGGLCGVWKHRESTCATWFCKHTHGNLGFIFWDRLRDVLRCAEIAVARHAMVELDVGPRALAFLFPSRERANPSLTAEELDGVASSEQRALAWGRWVGREHEFYQRAAEIAAPLAWNDVAQLGGIELALQLSLLREAHAELRVTAPPARVRASAITIASGVPHAADHVVLGTYSASNPLEVPAILVECLPYFDGRPTAEAVDAIEAALGVRLEDDLVRKLFEYGLLTEG